MYSVEFLLRFQNDQTEPPEKIKLFSEIYMPSGENGMPVQGMPVPVPVRGTQQQPSRQGGKKGGTPNHPGGPHYHMQGGHQGFAPGRTKSSTAAFTLLEHRVEDPFKIVNPGDEFGATVKAVNGILNKITPEKYAGVMQSMLDLHFDISNQEMLDQIISAVFERAVQHLQYCNLYADVCRDLTQKFGQNPQNNSALSNANKNLNS